MTAIETRSLTKAYKTTIAVDHLDLQVPKGSVYGFLGPNGAGKTTTLRMLMGFATPTSGEAYVLGQKVTSQSIGYRRQIGYLPDVPAYYNWMKAWEFLAFAGQLMGMHGTDLKKRTEELLEVAGLKGVKTSVGGYSRGMKQRLGLAQALLHRPQVVLLDEPTSALDPIGRRDVLEMIGQISGETTVLLSTHILSDVERVCDTVAILHKGRLLTQEPIRSLKDRYIQPAISLKVKGETGGLTEKLKTTPWVQQVELVPEEEGALRLLVTDLEAAQALIPQTLVDLGLGLREFRIVETTLEDVFVRLVKEE